MQSQWAIEKGNAVATYKNEILEQVNPRFLGAYLSAKGWTVQEQGASQIWKYRNGSNSDVEITVDSANPDTSAQIVEALGKLETVEGRPGAAILDELAHSDSDIVRVAVRNQETANHTLAMENSVRLMQGIQRLLSAVAWSTLEPSAYLSGKKPPQVGQYIRDVRIASLSAEGYGHTAISPLSQVDQEALSRRVMLTLVTALNEIVQVASAPAQFGEKDTRRHLIEEGVSANFCEALVLLFGKASTKKKRAKTSSEAPTLVDVNFTWSPMVAVPKDTPTSIILDAEMIPVLQDFSGMLRETSPQENFQLQGLVTDLKRSGNAGTGKISVSNITREEPEKVSLELEDDLYELAIQAHRLKGRVMCVGTLVKNNKSYELLNPSLAPIEQPELAPESMPA
jgi:hypothetical protein